MITEKTLLKLIIIIIIIIVIITIIIIIIIVIIIIIIIIIIGKLLYTIRIICELKSILEPTNFHT